MNCHKCEHLITNEPLKVIDKPSLNFMCDEEYHFEEGYRCTWNGISSFNLEDLQKGSCRCRK